MEDINLLYRAYKEYKKLCITDDDTSRFYRAYANNNLKENEDVIHIFNVCKINDDWVQAIEAGLPFIEKAIKEERQFIRNDGEVLPIEKIRKTGKDSIQDLAKHANYITHEAPADAATEVMPDKMLVIRKESDFAIYENRVLFAALMYLKDFVMSRLETIKEATNTYQVTQKIQKLIDMGARKIDVTIDYKERRSNDPLLSAKNTEKDIIDRLDAVLTSNLALLKTPLMREVSKTEMVSRPIQKTNILKMNRNFRESLALFDYIASYQGQGFTIEHIEKSYYPMSKEMSESYSESLIFLSFLNYIYANELVPELEQQYDALLKKEQTEKEDEILSRLRSFHASAKDKEQTINEFLILFEEGYRILERRNEQLTFQLRNLEVESKKEVEFARATAQEATARANKEAEKKIREAQEECDNVVKKNNEEFEAKSLQMTEDFNKEIAVMNKRANDEKEEFKAQYAEHVAEMEKENKEIKDESELIKTTLASIEAELLTYKAEGSLVKAYDFSSEEQFDRLEQIKIAFDKFFDKAWEEAKKAIKKEVFKGGKKK